MYSFMVCSSTNVDEEGKIIMGCCDSDDCQVLPDGSCSPDCC